MNRALMVAALRRPEVRWQLFRPFAYAAIAGFLTFALIGITNPNEMHAEFTPDGVRVVTVR